VLVSLCFLLPEPWLVALALAGTLAAFATSHVWFGWTHVLAKLPLGALALICVLAVGNVVPAVIAHVVFNLRIWSEIRAGAYVPVTA
jgi:hypothetical protein